MQSESGSELVIEYELSTESELVDATLPQKPLRVTLGAQGLHPVIEKYFVGREAGEEFEVHLDPTVAFGEPNPDLKFQISRKKLPEKVRGLESGASFEGPGPDRKIRVFRVVEADEKKIVVDGNHPLAGATLKLKARILEVIASAK